MLAAEASGGNTVSWVKSPFIERESEVVLCFFLTMAMIYWTLILVCVWVGKTRTPFFFFFFFSFLFHF